MEIIIEVGNEAIQEYIRHELGFVDKIAESLKLNVSRIIIPGDFQAKVNEYQGRDDYKVQRGVENAQVTVAAKIIEDGDNITILLSPYIFYLQSFDTMVRCFLMVHELMHVVNKGYFLEIPKGSFALENYLGNLYIMFDEYTADRYAYSMIEGAFEPHTEAWELYNQDGVLGYLNPTSDPRYYEHILSEIKKFRYHADVNRYWKSIWETVHVVSISIVHGFARYHEHLENYKKLEIPSTKFINEKTFALMDYFKTKYKTQNYDLNDGIGLMEEYLTNFGVRFEDRPEGGWMQVLDI